MKFKSDIEIQAGVEAGGSTGSSGQVLSSTGSSVAWINQGDITSGEAEVAKSLQVTVKNVSGGELTKGTVVHTAPTASPPSGNVIEVIAADYDDTTKMPAIGILKETIANEAEGEAVMTGALSGIATNGFSIGDELYVGADGALTNVKPQTAGQLIQKIAVCVKSHASNGLIKIFGAGRSNDVPLPLYIDNANQRLGIGVASPDEKLHIGDGTVPSATLDGVLLTLGDSQYYQASDGAKNIFMGVDSTSYGIIGMLTDHDLGFRTNNSIRMLIDNLGNVGIGNTDPDALLDVGVSIHQSATGIDVAGGEGGANVIGLTTSSNHNWLPFTDGSNYLSAVSHTFRNADHTTDWMYISSDGNVGIGTNGPNARLEIKSSTEASQGGNLLLNRGADKATHQNYLIFQSNNNSDEIYIGTPVNSSNAVIGAKQGDMIFQTGSYSERMRIDSSGNVGIGTANMYARFNVKATSHNNGISVNRAADNTAALYIGNDGGGTPIFAANNADMIFGKDFSGTFTENMRLTNGGNLGIGTNSPSSKLSIGSNAITTKKPTVVIADGVAGGSLVIRGLSPILSFDRTGASPQNKILMDNAGLEFKTGTLDSEGNVDFKINPDGDLSLAKGAKISNQENTDIDSAAAEVVAQVAISYTAAFFDFVVKKGTNVRSGTVYACHNGDTTPLVEFTETSTNDLGDTSDVTLSVDISGSNLRLLATVTSDNWSIKSLIRAI